jgi:hypothetical protein
VYSYRLSEIAEVWDGSIILIWKPPFAARQLSPGMRGEEVRWVCQALDKLDGKAPSLTASDLYDEDLQRRVMKFQRERSLTEWPCGRGNACAHDTAVAEPSASITVSSVKEN